jgi:hypothetical protein
LSLNVNSMLSEYVLVVAEKRATWYVSVIEDVVVTVTACARRASRPRINLNSSGGSPGNSGELNCVAKRAGTAEVALAFSVTPARGS